MSAESKEVFDKAAEVSKKKDEGQGCGLLEVFIMVFAGVICGMIGAAAYLSYDFENQLKKIKADAIRYGYAEYNVNPANQPVFEWITPKSSPERIRATGSMSGSIQ